VFVAFCVGIGHCDGLIISFRGVLPSGVCVCVFVCLTVGDLETGGLGPIWSVTTGSKREGEGRGAISGQYRSRLSSF